MRKVICRFLAVAMLATILLGFCLPVTARADENTLGSISVDFPIDGALFRVYYVGSYEAGQIVLNGNYNQLNLDDLTSAAAALADIFTMNKVQPYQYAWSENGAAYFHDLPQGVYLLAGNRVLVDGMEYAPVATFVVVMETGDSSTLHPIVTNKYVVRTPPTELTVLKIWENDNEEVRPTYVKIQLLRSGVPEGDPIYLNRDNNWRYTWTDLDPNEVWSAIELEVPRFYKCTTQHQGNIFVFFNTRLIPPLPYTPGIPQTGQLWWPVYALAIAGMGMIAIGLIRRRKSEEDA